ncbi:MAG: LysR family transcriptional regulator [Thalassobaculales bacterium]
MSFRNFNLNLLLVFEAMMTHRNTTRAGKALGISQSAISNSLSQLRAVLDDPLFTRNRNEMVPTPRALELAGPVSAALLQVREAIDSSAAFDAARSARVFRIGMSDYSAYVLLEGIVAAVREQSDSIRISVKNVSPADICEAVEQDEVDICIGFADRSGGYLQTMTLFEDQWVCARRQSRKPLTMEEYAGGRHVVIGNDLSNHIDRLLALRGITRTNVVSLPFCLAGPLLIEESDLLLTLPRRIAEQFRRGRRIDICELPYPTRGFPVIMMWHERAEHDPGARWMRSVIAAASGQFRVRVDAPAAVEAAVRPPPAAAARVRATA